MNRPASRIDPLLLLILGFALVVGGGLAFYGATRSDGVSVAQAAPSTAVPAPDATTKRALRAAAAANRSAVPAPGTAAARKQARRASAKGASSDPFSSARSHAATDRTAAKTTTTPTGASSSTSGGNAAGTTSASRSAVEQAHEAVAQAQRSADATHEAIDGVDGGVGAKAKGSGSTAGSATDDRSATTPSSPDTGPSAGPSASPAASGADGQPGTAGRRPARVSFRIRQGTHVRVWSRLAAGSLLPHRGADGIARFVRVASDGRTVSLRLARGVSLPPAQAPGTLCAKRSDARDGGCLVAHVRAGQTIVLRIAGQDGAPGATIRIRVLSVWRDNRRIDGR